MTYRQRQDIPPRQLRQDPYTWASCTRILQVLKLRSRSDVCFSGGTEDRIFDKHIENVGPGVRPYIYIIIFAGLKMETTKYTTQMTKEPNANPETGYRWANPEENHERSTLKESNTTMEKPRQVRTQLLNYLLSTYLLLEKRENKKHMVEPTGSISNNLVKIGSAN